MAISSLVFAVAVLALWARSLTVADWLSHSHSTKIEDRYARTDWIVLSGYGFIGVTRADLIPIDDASASWLQELDRQSGLGWSFGPVESYSPSWELFVGGLSRFGFSSGINKQGRTIRAWKSFEVPDWVLLLLVSIPAQFGFVRMLRAWRKRHQIGFPLKIDDPAIPRPTGDAASPNAPMDRHGVERSGKLKAGRRGAGH